MVAKPLSKIAGLFAGTAMLGLLASCAPVIKNHGYAPVPEELATITEGRDTRGSVRRKIGRPSGTGIFTRDGWYYVASTVEHFAYYEPEVIDRRVVAILFDDQDFVRAVNTYGLEDGRIIDLETNTTPTFGRELTIIEQAFGNIGVNAEEFFGDN